MTNADEPVTMSSEPAQRLQRAKLSLEGLSVGDAFGQWFFSPMSPMFFAQRELPPKPWPYTDDTAMAISIVEILHEYGQVDRDALARRFAERFDADPGRGYGSMAIEILRAIGNGRHWSQAAREAFYGAGSMGNGGAMRAGPIGAWFADDLQTAAEQARLSAEVTHAHPEGQAGAIAVAVAAAEAARMTGRSEPAAGEELLRSVVDLTPQGPTRDGLYAALHLGLSASPQAAASRLGNGSRVVSGDTVPFTLWAAAKHLTGYEEALWSTVSARGDMDTNCAIVGSIVVMANGLEGIPEVWRRSREALDLCCETGEWARQITEP
jgi:ADP-ribosylglycohydrolase